MKKKLLILRRHGIMNKIHDYVHTEMFESHISYVMMIHKKDNNQLTFDFNEHHYD
jgi:hypothetical protein